MEVLSREEQDEFLRTGVITEHLQTVILAHLARQRISRMEMSKRLKLSAPTVGNWLRGSIRHCNMICRKRLLEYLEEEMTDLVLAYALHKNFFQGSELQEEVAEEGGSYSPESPRGQLLTKGYRALLDIQDRIIGFCKCCERFPILRDGFLRELHAKNEEFKRRYGLDIS